MLALTALAHDRSLPQSVVLSAIQAALEHAYKKDANGQEVRVDLDQESGNTVVRTIKIVVETVEDNDLDLFSIKESEAIILPPVPDPPSFRDFYAFEQHVRSARKLRGLDMHPDWFKIPIFYFSNPVALYGDKAEIPYPRGTDELDFELEFAIIIANGGSNISIDNAKNFMNDYYNFKREVNGKYYLDYLKVREEVDKDGGTYFRLWFPDRIETIYSKDDRSDPTTIDTADNLIGKIPAVILYNSKSHKRGIGQSDLQDIADLQKAIYNEYSEMEQLIRLTNHPSLVKTPSVNASAGPGAIIEMPEEIETNLKPYLLQPKASNLNSIMQSIENKVNSINRIAHIGAVRTTKTQVSSGIALQTEFELLNARLSEKADNLQIAEEQIFRLYALFQNATFDGEINYPDSFNIRDYASDLVYFQQAKSMNIGSPTIAKQVDKEIATLFSSFPLLICAATELILSSENPNILVVKSCTDNVFSELVSWFIISKF